MNSIVFSTQLIPKVIDGSKAMFREVVKPQPNFDIFNGIYDDGTAGFKHPAGVMQYIKCPYKIGQRVWVKETYALIYKDGQCAKMEEPPYDILPECPCDHCRVEYRADSGALYPGDWPAEEARGNDEAPKWRSPLFMPKELSRLDIIIQTIGVEQIQEISEEDAVKEGVFEKNGYWCSTLQPVKGTYQAWATAVMAFEKLWNSLHTKPKPAKHNPYTWAKEDCYVSYPWEDIREERDKRGKVWYVVGNPAVFKYGFRAERRGE